VNLVIFSEPNSSFSLELLDTLGVRSRLIPISFVPSPTIAAETGVKLFPSFVINRPLDGVRLLAQRYSPATLFNRLQPLITPIRSEVIGETAHTKWTLAVLLDRSNASHWHEAGAIFRHCGTVFGRKVAYQACDFFECPSYASVLEVVNVTVPVYFALKKFGEQVIERLYRGGRKSPTAIRVWMREQMMAMREEKKRTAGFDIPAMPASSFKKFIEPRGSPAVVFIGSPEEKGYYQRLAEFARLKKTDNWRGARFFKFDPLQQPIGGIPIERDGRPRIAVFASDREMCTLSAEKIGLTGDLQHCLQSIAIEK
jgi:hypothetical protein